MTQVTLHELPGKNLEFPMKLVETALSQVSHDVFAQKVIQEEQAVPHCIASFEILYPKQQSSVASPSLTTDDADLTPKQDAATTQEKFQHKVLKYAKRHHLIHRETYKGLDMEFKIYRILEKLTSRKFNHPLQAKTIQRIYRGSEGKNMNGVLLRGSILEKVKYLTTISWSKKSRRG